MKRNRNKISSSPTTSASTAKSLKCWEGAKVKNVVDHNTSLTTLVLSLVWLLLCSGLVYKHYPLIYVFFAFATCFVLVGILQRIANQTSKNRQKNLIGLLAIAIAQCITMLPGQTKSLAPSTATDSGHECFLALSIAAGYLAFDQWFSFLYTKTTKVMTIMEDAVTLSIMVIVLVADVVATNTSEEMAGRKKSLVHDYKVCAQVWFGYKLLRLLVDSFTTSKEYQRILQDKVMQTKHSTISASQPAMIWNIHGKQYNLTDYIDCHPGGREAILLAANREDATALFDSYHPFTKQHEIVLQRYCVNGNKNKHKKDTFYSILCQRVAHVLRQNNLDPKRDRAASWQRTAYYFCLIVAVVVTGKAHIKASILGSFLFALVGWWIGALGHDAGHFAASRKAWINDIGVFAMSLLCNPIQWQHQHTFAHHSFTNAFEHDPDLHHFHTFLRVHRKFSYQSVYKYQTSVLYVLFAYCFVVFGTCIWIPWGMMKEGTLYGIVQWTDRNRPVRAAAAFAHTAVYVLLIVVWPFCVHNTVLSAVAAVTVHLTTSGLLFAMFSQINHLNEASIEDESNEERKKLPESRPEWLKDSWAVAQVETSNNFCPQSAFWHFFSNGLNLQIEHHLFPGLNHCHLPLIQPIVQATCEEFGINYKNYGSWSDVMQATLEWLERLSVDNVQTTVST